MNAASQEIDLPNNQIVLTGNILIFLKLINIEYIIYVYPLVYSVRYYEILNLVKLLFLHGF